MLRLPVFSTFMRGARGEEPKPSPSSSTPSVPGKRCLPDFPTMLSAGGGRAGSTSCFPLDVDLAFKKLNEIKKTSQCGWKPRSAAAAHEKNRCSTDLLSGPVGIPAFALSFAGGKPICLIAIVKGSSPENKACVQAYTNVLPENQAKAAE